MDQKLLNRTDEYEAPVLLGAEDLEDVVGGCLFSCSNGDCAPVKK